MRRWEDEGWRDYDIDPGIFRMKESLWLGEQLPKEEEFCLWDLLIVREASQHGRPENREDKEVT